MPFRHRHYNVSKRAFKRFLSQNKGILGLVLFVLIGAGIGSCIFPLLSDEYRQFLSSVYQPAAIPTDFISGCTYACAVGFRALIVLIGLFICGLTAFGCPLITLILVVFGVQIGVSDCAVYIDSGLLTLAITEIIPLLCIVAGVVNAADSSLRMSTTIAKQLLPTAAHCGSIWTDFKRYLIADSISVFLLLLAAVIKTLIKMYW